MDWIADHAWVVWMVVGVLLAVAEVTMLDFTLLMLGVGAVAGGVVALVFPHVFWLQVVVALVVAVSTVGLLRPALEKRMHPPGELRTGAALMVGRTGTVTRAIGADESGSVRIGGELWTARAYHDEPIAAGERIEVMTIDGATAMVYPTDATPVDPVSKRIDSELDRHAAQTSDVPSDEGVVNSGSAPDGAADGAPVDAADGPGDGAADGGPDRRLDDDRRPARDAAHGRDDRHDDRRDDKENL